MQELVPVEVKQIGEDEVLSVDARKLHGVLEVGKDFSSWVKQYLPDFEENQDYIVLTLDGERGNKGGHNRKDYLLSLDMAKELCMMSRTEKGKEVRKYFIEVEKQYRQQAQPQTQLETLQVVVNQMVEQEKEQARQAQELEEVKERQRITETKLEDYEWGAEFFTITAYHKLFTGESVSNDRASTDGRQLRRIADNKGIELGHEPHPVWGKVNSYPKALLDAYYRGDYSH